MKHTQSAKTGSLGVAIAAHGVQKKLGWLFRGQHMEDYGIDAHAEVVDSEEVTGRLLALQIKSGPSWFKKKNAHGWWFRPEPKHVQYWTSHSLPVAVILVDPDTEVCYWQLINSDTIQTSSKGKPRVLVPKGNVLDESAVMPLTEASKGDPYELRLRELRLALPWIRLLAGDQRLVVDAEEWINKTSGRGTISLGIDHENGEDPEYIATWDVMLGLQNYGEAIPKLFAWADMGHHAETYENYDGQNWHNPDYFDMEASYSFGDPGATPESEHSHQPLHPYENSAGEVDYWRLELFLNALGRAFLTVDSFATSGKRQLTK